jgi:hypothetical protein
MMQQAVKKIQMVANCDNTKQLSAEENEYKPTKHTLSIKYMFHIHFDTIVTHLSIWAYMYHRFATLISSKWHSL